MPANLARAPHGRQEEGVIWHTPDDSRPDDHQTCLCCRAASTQEEDQQTAITDDSAGCDAHDTNALMQIIARPSCLRRHQVCVVCVIRLEPIHKGHYPRLPMHGQVQEMGCIVVGLHLSHLRTSTLMPWPAPIHKRWTHELPRLVAKVHCWAPAVFARPVLDQDRVLLPLLLLLSAKLHLPTREGPPKLKLAAVVSSAVARAVS